MSTIPRRYRAATWVAWLLAALLLLDVASGALYGVVVASSAGVLALLARRTPLAGALIGGMWPRFSCCPPGSWVCSVSPSGG